MGECEHGSAMCNHKVVVPDETPIWMTFGCLTADDLGKTITLTYEMTVVTGQITKISHEAGWSRGPKTWLGLKSGDFRWFKGLPSEDAFDRIENPATESA